MKLIQDYSDRSGPILHPLRQFVSKKDMLYFPKVCNAAFFAMDKAEKRELALRLGLFDDLLKRTPVVSVGRGGNEISPKQLISLLLYSTSFHTNPKARRGLAEWLKSPIAPMLFFVFETFVVKLDEVFASTAWLIDARVLSTSQKPLPGMPV